MRFALPIALGLLIFGSAIPASQDRGGGLLGPPDRGGRSGGRDAGGTRGGQRGGRDALPPEVVELGAAYFNIADYNGDSWISYREGRESLSLDRDRFARIDKDSDGRIDAREFQEVFEMSIRKVGDFPPPKPDPEGGPVELPEFDADAFARGADFQPASSINELFGRAEARTLEEGATRQPPFIAGPIPQFRRLDLDLDGEITNKDLDELLRPMQVQTRIRAVIAIMDTDESGGISRAEFDAAMTDGE
jgi:EF hand domain-containing protein